MKNVCIKINITVVAGRKHLSFTTPYSSRLATGAWQEEISQFYKKGGTMKQRQVLYRGFVTLTKNEKSGLEVVYATDSVVFLIHVADTNQILMVEQSREPMKNKTNQHGLITELPAGRFDIRLGVKGLAQKEALEEVGARVSKSDIGILNKGIPVALSPGILTEKMYLVYIKINSNQIEKGQRVFGNKSEGEKIRRRFVTVEELKKMTFQDMKTFALAQWFLRQIGK